MATGRTLEQGGFHRGYHSGMEEGKREGKIEGKREGKIEGKIEGKKEGMKESASTIAKKLLVEGMSIEKVAELTSLSIEELQLIKAT